MLYFFKRCMCWSVSVILLFVLAGCGSSGSSSSGSSSSGSDDSALTITVALLDSAGNEIRTISQGNPGTLRVTLHGASVKNQLVTVTTTKGSLDSDGTALTDSNGVAELILQADDATGAGEINVTAGDFSLETPFAFQIIGLPDAEIGSIEFVSAEPDLIAIEGSANSAKPSTSVVKFLVKDTLGNPVKGKQVNFELSTYAGGLSVTPDNAESGADGIAQVVVRSGHQATHVRVKATIADTSITTLSDALTVSTGFPDQNSFSISADIFNPEGWNYDGEVVNIIVRAADHFNNPVSDGTMISFITNGGVVDPSCSTVDGACSVEWRSQNPRPANGRIIVLATSVGEESFTDQNGSGLYEIGDDYFDVNEDDLAEAYIDVNENRIHDTNEEFIDFNGDQFYTPGNGKYNGTLCSEGCSTELVDVRDSMVISMSGSFAKIDTIPSSVTLSGITQVKITISDVNGNSMPSDTKLDVTAPDNASIEGDSSFTVLNTTYPSTFYIFLKPKDGAVSGDTGNMELKVTTPKENITSKFVSVTVP